MSDSGLFSSFYAILCATLSTCSYGVSYNMVRLSKTGIPADLVEKSIKSAYLKLGYTIPTEDQVAAITEFLKGKDIFVSLPTGSGKSLCFATLPYVFDFLKHFLVAGNEPIHSSICVVVSPLVSLMKDQVAKFGERGLRCAYVGEEQTDREIKSGVLAGEFQLVYMSPESLLCVLQWREMFRNKVYEKNLIAIAVDEAHCVEQWLVTLMLLRKCTIKSNLFFCRGESFREEFNNLGEARSIIPRSVNIIALTATATKATREFVQRCLCMTNCFVIQKLPNRLNIKYTVQPKPDDVAIALSAVIDDIAAKGIAAEKTVVFCRTYAECCMVFEVLVNELGHRNSLFFDGTKTIINMFTAVSDVKVKDAILAEFVNPSTYLRVVVATIAFGMGLDAPDITRVIHWGPSHSIEAYVQESGRSGRDGRNALAEMYFEGKDFAGSSGPSQSMKEYCKNSEECRRQQLMHHFDTQETIEKPMKQHDCCDVCATSCDCTNCSVQVLQTSAGLYYFLSHRLK